MGLLTPPHLKSPQLWAGKRIGLLGGSFNPPHPGHVHITKAALHALQLDSIWWLVTPQNPLKTEPPGRFEQRIAQCRAIMQHPRVIISDMEKQLGTKVTFETISKLKIHFPRTDFVWISGMDNALTIHKWGRWQELLQLLPTLHITRMPATSFIQNCPLRMLSSQNHKTITRGGRYPLDSGISYWLLHKNMVDISSTEIRQKDKIIL